MAHYYECFNDIGTICKEVTSPSENGGLPATAGSVIANKALEDTFLPLRHTVTGIVKYK
ncbi:hypothetical protein [Paenisporosarcina sp. OV554]|uniref:hypothetical protein n=1 Tax=Paenisporosarcina sp. OV554 TaxID=2135694 RepID=UPI0013050291|nr:hypothetical protein [Paenisporosarcina sp. OV554]